MTNRTFRAQRMWRLLFFGAGLVAALLFTSSAFCAPGLRGVSVRDPGIAALGGAGGDSSAPLMTPDARYVLFASSARNLATNNEGGAFKGSANPVLNVYRRDRLERTTVLVTPGLDGSSFANADCLPVDFSTNGAFALIESVATNLVSDDTNGMSDVFVRNIVSGETILISAATNGAPGNRPSYNPVMTPDGRYVSFTSEANNLVAKDTNGVPDIFLRDLQTGDTTLISVNIQPPANLYTYLGADFAQVTPDGSRIAFLARVKSRSYGTIASSLNVRDRGAGTTIWASTGAKSALALTGSADPVCFDPVISEDGAYVAYKARSSISVTYPVFVLRYGVQNGTTDLLHKDSLVQFAFNEEDQTLSISADGARVAFLAKTNYSDSCVLVWDVMSGTRITASLNLTNGLSTNAAWAAPRLDPQGRWVDFLSTAADLVTNSLATGAHLFRRDFATGNTVLLDRTPEGSGWPLALLTMPVISADGELVAFDCVQNSGPAQRSQVFVLNNRTGETELVSVQDANLPSLTGNGHSYARARQGGQRLVFVSAASDLVQSDTNGFPDVFAQDTVTGATILVSTGADGQQGNGPSSDPLISRDGRFLAFTSVATNLVEGDNNVSRDVFLRDLSTPSKVELVSRGYTGAIGTTNSTLAGMSQDGRYVLFRSYASNITPSPATSGHLFLRDMLAGTNFHVSAGTASVNPQLSNLTADGRYVVYATVIPAKLFLWDRVAQTNIITPAGFVMATQTAIAPNGSHFAYTKSLGGYTTYLQNVSDQTLTVVDQQSAPYTQSRFSGDSRSFAYGSVINGLSQIYVFDISTKTKVLVSRDALGNPASAHSDSPSLSYDGRFVAYRSYATDLVPNDTLGTADIFLFDRGSTKTVVLSEAFPRDGQYTAPFFGQDGRTVFFVSSADNPDLMDFNRNIDVVSYTLTPTETGFLVQTASGGGAQNLIWPVSPGKTYRVQCKDDISETTWHDVQGTPSINGEQATYIDPNPALKRFYRVVEE